MTRYGKGTAINLTKVTAPDQINVINDNFKKIQTQLMGLKTYLEPIAQAGKEANDRLNMYLGSDPPVSRPQMTDYAQKQITMGPEPPEEPEVGEVWFVTDEEGNVIAIRHWDGSQWVDDVDNEAVAEAIEQAQQEAEIAKQQAQTAVDTANQATQQANEAIQQAQQGFDAAQNALAEAALAQSIATNAIGQAQTAFDNAQSALTKALEALDATNILSQQVDQNTGDISTLFQTASSLGSRVSDAEGNISAIQQMADSLSTRIENAEGNISSLTQTALGLQTSVSDLQGDVSTLTQTANSLNSRITNVQNDLTNLQIGGRNLIRNSGNFKTLGNWAPNGQGTSITLTQKDGFSVLEGIKSITGENVYGIKNNTEYVFSAEVMFDRDVSITADKPLHCQVAISGNVHGGKESVSLISKDTIAKANTWTVISVKIKTKSDVTITYFKPFIYGLADGTKFWVKWWKLEEGNRATDWTPAPEDYDAQFSSINQTIDSITTIVQDAQGDISALQQTANSLATRITGAEGNISTLTQTVDGLQTQVSAIEGDVSTLTQTASSLQSRIQTAEGNINTLTQTANSLTSQIKAKADQSWVSSQISQLSNAINLRVEKDKIINQINISTEGILIDGKKIHITGQTTIDNAVIKDAMIESVSASKISATSLSAISANLGEVTAGIIRGLTIDGVTGTFGSVSVKDGDFLFKDSITGATYSLVPKTNLINDHSFETLQPSGNIGSDKYYSIGDAGEWIKTGNPKLTSNEGSESANTEAIFGNQAVVVNNANYVETIMSYLRMARGKVHTISLYAKKPAAYTAGIPRVYVYVYNENPLTREKDILWSTTLTARSAPPSDYRPARYAFNFTMPNITSDIDTYTTFAVRVLSANSNWVLIDGVQLVEGTYAGPYDPDNTLFKVINGYLPVRRLYSIREVIAGGWLYTDAVDSNPYSSGIHLYLRPKSSGEVRATRTGTTNAYVPVRASSFPTASLAENKLDIHVWEESALEKIRSATIYEYYLKSELEQGIQRKRQGLVIGEGYNTPDGVVDGDGVEQYLMNAWSWKAIQELDTEQQSIKEDAEWMKLEIQFLKQQNAVKDQKISELEEKIRQLEAKII